MLVLSAKANIPQSSSLINPFGDSPTRDVSRGLCLSPRGLCPHKPHLFEAASNQLPSSTVRLSVGLPRCFTSLPSSLNKLRSHTHPRSRDSVAMPPTIRANSSAPGTFMKQRNSRSGVYVAIRLRRIAPTKIHQPNIST